MITESQWLSSDDPTYLSKIFPRFGSATVTNLPMGTVSMAFTPRKCRLFAVSVARMLEIDATAEELAFGEEWAERGHVGATGDHLPRGIARWSFLSGDPGDAAMQVCGMQWAAKTTSMKIDASTQARKAQIARDIFGNPFRPVPFDTAWRTPDAVRMAEAAYYINDFATVVYIADALEEAGCVAEPKSCPWCGGHGTMMQATPDRGPAPACDLCKGSGRKTHPIIANLRSPGPHYRGMWGLDLLLGKS